ncbi:DUF2798 domain-containing protein [Vibrio ulleungensis]|uniref:DUF2798 domain-containing protein n=1 Tax=Vibrio ulleungensis TaxID=2807619 RepID=A0ABS2HFI5_9VIBR|nr:DUF2798 domain-containing protein [Vibrio ulleungensis]MBM7034829.1 DUF2798 domain-containing protein [Vibrio ulleungensis]
MKKFPRKFQYPLIASMVMPTMLLSMPAILVSKHLPADESFLDAWLSAVSYMVPIALMLFAVVAPLARLIVTRVLLVPEDSTTPDS